ncbi:Rbl2p Ecym_2359 [Eremothecium cymbalariae DBVPG|uniref:Tubulin-specific chaperone A n=1 Tax=Eremothecium cymbalariae (strain CBS 270.75 / DBVPG 7215 / KCTC 17166 / NRRL Y-17582) TaxID=931890 RepID=G8JNM5_ERECY|nr:Hypothetical protein Ecym_2359 [Eremothecium cymbalariae DBVPG\
MAPTQLEIKVRALQRLVKEENYYQEELKEQKERVEQLQQDFSVDPYDLKKHVEVMQDTERLLPKFYEKVEQFYEDLKNFLGDYQGDEDTTDAYKVLDSAKELVANK